MTGSDACVLAAFANEQAAQQALSRLPRGMTGFVARALDRHPLGRLPKAMSAFKNFGRDSFPWGVAKW
jgi:hypothetical protein